MPACAHCEKSIEPRPQNPWAPFCSERCRLIDLGKWLGEEYRVPAAPPQEGDGQEAPDLDVDPDSPGENPLR